MEWGKEKGTSTLRLTYSHTDLLSISLPVAQQVMDSVHHKRLLLLQPTGSSWAVEGPFLHPPLST